MALSSRKTQGGTGVRRLRLGILDGRALQRTNEVGFPLCAPFPVPPVHRPNRGDNLPAPSFPSTRANPLNQMKDTGFVRSLESGGKRFALLAGSNRRNLVFREPASLAVKVQSNCAVVGPFVGVAKEICLEIAPSVAVGLDPRRETPGRLERVDSRPPAAGPVARQISDPDPAGRSGRLTSWALWRG